LRTERHRRIVWTFRPAKDSDSVSAAITLTIEPMANRLVVAVGVSLDLSFETTR